MNMAARNNRPRQGPSRDDPVAAEEEIKMWSQILVDLKTCKSLKERSEAAMAKAKALQDEIGDGGTSDQWAEVASFWREGHRLAEEEKAILSEEPHDVIKNIGILKALCAASANEPRNPQQSKSRGQKIKQKADMDGAADSPGPSPSVATTSATKLKGSSVRSGSVPSTKDCKETSVDGAEGSKGPSVEKSGKLFVGAEVAYKQAKMKEDGSQWIQCNIVAITEAGNKKRYEVQDPEPDDSGAPGQIYKTSAAALIAIPSAEAVLTDYPVGKPVLARYPETTTFYRAVVTGVKKDVYRLKFEDDQNQEMEVGRRFVLDFGGK